MRLRINEICEELDLTMSELGKRCDIAQPALSDYNRGKRNPTLQTMKKIADATGVSVRELIDERDEMDRDIEWFSQFPPGERLVIAERDSESITFLRQLGDEMK